MNRTRKGSADQCSAGYMELLVLFGKCHGNQCSFLRKPEPWPTPFAMVTLWPLATPRHGRRRGHPLPPVEQRHTGTLSAALPAYQPSATQPHLLMRPHQHRRRRLQQCRRRLQQQ